MRPRPHASGYLCDPQGGLAPLTAKEGDGLRSPDGEKVNGRPSDRIASHRARSLLGWLAVHPGLHPRGRVAGLFWPDVLEESARSSLRTTLATLRRELGGSAARALTASRESVGIDPCPGVRIDLQAFEQLVSRGELKQAVALCRGDLLADLDDDWVNESREHHRHRLLGCARRAGGASRALWGPRCRARPHARTGDPRSPLGRGSARTDAPASGNGRSRRCAGRVSGLCRSAPARAWHRAVGRVPPADGALAPLAHAGCGGGRQPPARPAPFRTMPSSDVPRRAGPTHTPA